MIKLAHVPNGLLPVIDPRNFLYFLVSSVTYLIGDLLKVCLIFVEENFYSKRIFRYLIFLYCQNWSSKLFFKSAII